MLKTVGDAATEKFITQRKNGFSGLDPDLTDQRLNEINAASRLSDISPLKSVGLHKLTGDLAGFWSVNLNDQWRLIFKFEDGDAYDVTIIDTHKKKRR